MSQGVDSQKKFDCYFLTTLAFRSEIESIDSQALTVGAESGAFRGNAAGGAARPDSRAARTLAACDSGGASIVSKSKQQEQAFYQVGESGFGLVFQ
jgi:hypothetical protein